MKPRDSTRGSFSLEPIFTAVIVGALLTAYCLHLSAVSKYAVDIPEMDEWVVFLSSPKLLKDGPAFWWLFHRHNEHYITMPILEGLLFYQINRWDVATLQIFNFFLFGFLLALIIHIGRRLRPSVPVWAVAAFVLFLLSPLGYRNHIWSIQVHVHFVLIFFLLAALALFSEQQRGIVLSLGLIAMTLACFSQAAGVAASLPLVLLYLTFKTSRVIKAENRRRKIREITQGLLFAIGGTVVLGSWFLDFHRRPPQGAFALPWTTDFWHFFLGAVSFGFGFEGPPTALGLLLLLLVVTPLVGTLIRYRGKPPAAFWTLAVILIGFLAILASIAIGRGGRHAFPSTFVASKYFHFAVVILPFTLLAWHWFLERRPRLKASILVVLWIIPAVGFADDLSLDGYRQMYKERLALEQSVRRYYHGVGPTPVPPRLPRNRPVERYLANAKKLGVSFALRLGLPSTSPGGGTWVGVDRPNRVIGRCERVEVDGTIRGWAAAPRHPNQSVKVFFTTDSSPDPDRGQRIGETLAKLPRRDVNLALGFPGDHGFSVKSPSNLAETAQVLHCWAVDPKDGSEHRLPGNDFFSSSGWPNCPVGVLNGVDSDGAIVGWALDPTHPKQSLRTHFFLDGPGPAEGGMPLGSTTADLLRLDVQRVTARGGNHGFRLQLPATVRDGQMHKIYGFAKSTDGEIFPLNHSGFAFR